MGVTGVRGFEKKIPGACFHQHWKHFIHINITDMRPLVIAPADMNPDPVLWDSVKRRIEGLNMHRGCSHKFLIALISEDHMASKRQVRAIDLEQ